MAWISVDQSMIGDRLRILHKEIGCSRNEAIGILVSLWLWGIDNAKEDGTLPSVDLRDIAEQITVGMNRELDPDCVAQILLETGWISEEDGVFKLNEWENLTANYERIIRENRSNSERQAKFRAKKKGLEKNNVTYNVDSNVTNSVDGKETDNEPKKTKKKSQAEKYGEDFEKLWDVYPRKDRKAEAFKCYLARIKEGHDPEVIMEAARNYSQICLKERKEKKFTLMAKTFLGTNLVFRDYIPKTTQSVEMERQRVNEGFNPFR